MDRHANVSVIVPAYNVEDTLFDCIASLVMQTLNDIEIIIVNDCSTDHTYMVMQMLEEKFPDKIIIIDSPVNRGPGGARNLGMEYASGDYIGFVDSDDYVAKDMYEKLYNEAVRTGYDIIDCGYMDEKADKAILMTGDNVSGKLDSEKRSILIKLGGFVWSKLFKASFLKKHNMTFRENISLEDADFILYSMAVADTIGNVKEPLYFYRNQPDSLSKTLNPHKFYNNSFSAMKAIYEKVSPLDNYAEIREAVVYELIHLYKISVVLSLKEGFNYPDYDVLAHLKEIREWRLKNVTIGYNNSEVKKRMSKDDIDAMIANDYDPELLYKKVKEKKMR